MFFPARIAVVVFLLASSAAAQEISTKNVPPENELPGSNVPSENVQPANNALPANSMLPDKPAPQGNFITRPFYDKQVRLLAEMNAGAAVMDDVASRMVIESGGYEQNPLMRPFVHNSGTLAAESVTEVWLMAFIADRMKHSSHPLLRKVWWLPQTLNISAKVSGGIYNSVLLTR
jgi:hypothetical protein